MFVTAAAALEPAIYNESFDEIVTLLTGATA